MLALYASPRTSTRDPLSGLPSPLRDVRVVRLAIWSERCRDADENGIAIIGLIEIGGHRHPLTGNGGGDLIGSDVADVGLNAAERLDLGLVDVEPQRWKSASQKTSVNGTPTYPCPTTPTRAECARIRENSSCCMVVCPESGSPAAFQCGKSRREGHLT